MPGTALLARIIHAILIAAKGCNVMNNVGQRTGQQRTPRLSKSFYGNGSPQNHGDDIHQKEIKEGNQEKNQGEEPDNLLQL